MTLTQRIVYRLAKRILRLHVARLTGSAGDRVFAAGDVLFTPNAWRILSHVGDNAPAGEYWEYSFRHVSGPLVGVDVPRVHRPIRLPVEGTRAVTFDT